MIKYCVFPFITSQLPFGSQHNGKIKIELIVSWTLLDKTHIAASRVLEFPHGFTEKYLKQILLNSYKNIPVKNPLRSSMSKGNAQYLCERHVSSWMDAITKKFNPKIHEYLASRIN